MATILLSAAGAAIGGSFGGTVFGLSTAVIGRAIGATLGRVVDQRLLGGGSQVVETGQIERFQLTGASEGTAIGSIYGRVRVGGQVIWSTRFKEKTKVRKEEVGGKGGGGNTTITKTYSYSISLAIALCEGEIIDIGRIWADGVEVARDDLNLRVYSGSEDQLPDPKIAAVEGTKNAPAYRGLAYVVIENLQLGRFGNRVPQFSFEVLRATDPDSVPENERSLSQTIKAVALIPGTGEYSLATTRVNYSNGFGWRKSANVNSGSGKSDFRTSLGQMNSELKQCSSVSLVVSWFGKDLRCARCRIMPKVEQTKNDGDRMPWRVSGVSRDSAQTVARVDGRSVYGGTPTDQSVIEAIRELKRKGKSVVFYPFILMEQVEGNSLSDPWSGENTQPALPWRGRITTEIAPGRQRSADGTSAAATEVKAFFGSARPQDFEESGDTVSFNGTTEWTLRRFVLHYAHLCNLAGGVDAFCIGSELRSLTQIRGAGNSFPTVDELVALAADVRSVLGPDTKITYAADWTEYFGFQPQDGSGDVFFHLDPLWASDNIDFIGIDNYMPLSDWRDGHTHADSHWGTIYDLDYLKANIAGGEGFDWYYSDAVGRTSQDRLPITDGEHGEPWVFRYKDIRSWWSQEHHERIGGIRRATATAWQPESKPIWFTEIGCAAVDKGTNQPNKFVDPKSSESSLPWFSLGTRDDLAQMQYLRATYQFWSHPENNPVSSRYAGSMVDVDRAHVWAWDARPYPSFPAESGIWSDAKNYSKGHWLNGRCSSESLAAVVADICARAGVGNVDVSELYGLVRGYSADMSSGARGALQPLSLAFGFDAAERGGQLRFKTRTGATDLEISEDALVFSGDPTLSLQRAAKSEDVGKVRLNYVQADGEFRTRTAEASFPNEEEVSVSVSDLPVCLTSAEGRRIAERWLAETRVARDTVTFSLPPSCAQLTAGDVISLDYGTTAASFRVDRVEAGEARKVDAVRVEPELFRPGGDVEEPGVLTPPLVSMPVYSQRLDLPLITGSESPVAPYLAAAADPWPGSVAVYSASEDDGYTFNTEIEEPSIVGYTISAMKAASPGVPDLGASLRVWISGGVLSSTTRTGLMNGANAVAIGDGAGGEWEIFQFANAELVDENTYDLSFRLRGQLGTDAVMPTEWPVGSFIVILDGAPTQIDLPMSVRGLERHYRVGPADRGYSDESFEHFLHTATGVGLRPYTPVHLKVQHLDDGSSTVSWIRRSRVDGDTWEGIEVPLGEDSERYVIRVTQDEVVRREEYVDGPEWTYTSEMKTHDALVGSITIQVAQISERYGAGPFQRIEIDE